MPERPELLVGQDPTHYMIETSMGRYEGKILYQDDVIIKLRVSDFKLVKILKTNISKIQILSSVAA
jgi:hypothetical protein